MKAYKIFYFIPIFFIVAALQESRVLAHSPATTPKGKIMETLYFQGVPSAGQIASWKSRFPLSSFLIQMDAPVALHLEPLLELLPTQKLRIEVNRFPIQDTVGVWKQLAARGTRLISMSAGLPNATEIDRLNAIGFTHITFVLTAFPSPAETEKLAHLTTPNVQITMATPRYPFNPDEEGKGLLAVPKSIRILFVANYWPGKWHTLLMRTLPQRIRIRIQNALPTQNALSEIATLENLDEITLDYDADIPAKVWAQLPEIPVQWLARNWIPSQKALDGLLAAKTPRRNVSLALDNDDTPTERELARIRALPFDVSWTREIQ